MPITGPTVLLIEDEPQMRRLLRAALGNQRYELVEAATAREGLAQAAGRNPALILLDLGLPDADGLTVTREIRSWSATPIIVISARGQEGDKVAALDAGADDYVTRVGVRVDLVRRQVFKDGVEVHLTPLEFKLLQTLVRHAGMVLTHRHLLKEVWGINAINQTHYLRVYITQLRHKLERDPAQPRLLLTETGVGYQLKAE